MGTQISASGSTIQKVWLRFRAQIPQPWLEPTVFGNE